MYYNKQGKQINIDVQKVLIMDKDYHEIGRTKKDGYLISTIWTGMDLSMDNSKVIFETMIFEGEKWNDLYCQRYSTLEEAKKGHRYAVRNLKKLIN